MTALAIISALILAACGSPAPTTTGPATSAPSPTQVQNSPTATAPAAVKTIKFSYTMPKGASIGAGFEWWGPEFEKRTNGRYKVEIYPAQTLVKIQAALDAVKTGAVELAFTTTATFTKLNASSRTEAVIMGLRNGLLTMDDISPSNRP